jgi:hypothetical protein
MTIRQPKGLPTGGQFAAATYCESQIQLQAGTHAQLAGRAAAAAAVLSEKREFLRRQQINAAHQHQLIACAAASHHVLEEHPSANVLIFEVRDERPYRLAEVFDADGNRLCKKPSGDWADDALREVRDESVYDLNEALGVDTDGRTELRIDLNRTLAALPSPLNGTGSLIWRRSPSGSRVSAIMADAAKDAYTYLSGMLYGDAGQLDDDTEAGIRGQVDDLGRPLGYDRSGRRSRR